MTIAPLIFAWSPNIDNVIQQLLCSIDIDIIELCLIIKILPARKPHTLFQPDSCTSPAPPRWPCAARPCGILPSCWCGDAGGDDTDDDGDTEERMVAEEVLCLWLSLLLVTTRPTQQPSTTLLIQTGTLPVWFGKWTEEKSCSVGGYFKRRILLCFNINSYWDIYRAL